MEYFHIWKLVYSECQWHYRTRTIFLKLVFCSSFSRLNLQQEENSVVGFGVWGKTEFMLSSLLKAQYPTSVFNCLLPFDSSNLERGITSQLLFPSTLKETNRNHPWTRNRSTHRHYKTCPEGASFGATRKRLFWMPKVTSKVISKLVYLAHLTARYPCFFFETFMP